MSRYRRQNTVPVPHGRGLEDYNLGQNRVNPPRSVLIVDQQTRQQFFIDPRYVQDVMNRAQKRTGKRRYARHKGGA